VSSISALSYFYNAKRLYICISVTVEVYDRLIGWTTRCAGSRV